MSLLKHVVSLLPDIHKYIYTYINVDATIFKIVKDNVMNLKD